ncbi:MAG: hypothetical protein WA364_12215 [Candidatus Nitrosopolaris sp.]
MIQPISMIIGFHHYHHKQLLILSQDIRYQIIYDRSDAIKGEQTHAHNVRLHKDVTLVVEDHSSASLVDFLSISILKTISQTNDWSGNDDDQKAYGSDHQDQNQKDKQTVCLNFCQVLGNDVLRIKYDWYRERSVWRE